MTDIKPLSIFGIVDQFQKDSIGKHYREKYAGIETDIAERGYNRFMADHFVALDHIKTSNGSTASDPTLAGPGPTPAAQMSEPTTRTATASAAARRPTQPGPSNQAPAAMPATTSMIEPGLGTPPQVALKSEAPTPPLVEHGTLPAQTAQPEALALVPGTASSGNGTTTIPTPGLPLQAQPATSTSVSAPSAVASSSAGPGAGEQAEP